MKNYINSLRLCEDSSILPFLTENNIFDEKGVKYLTCALYLRCSVLCF